MKLIPVERLPEKKRQTTYKTISVYVEEFMKMNVKYAKVEFSSHDYTGVTPAAMSFITHLRSSGDPVKVKIVNGDLYLIRTDMKEEV